MCSNDGDWETISQREVARTRKSHRCGSCEQMIPMGSRALFITGKYEGEIDIHHACMACVFCSSQDDHTALHICWGDMHDPQDDQQATHDYVRHCLDNGEQPTITGLEAALAQHAALAALEGA